VLPELTPPPPEVDRWAVASLRHRNRPAWALVRTLCTPGGYRQFCLVYAYFRWADDVVDAPHRVPVVIQAFVASQEQLIRGERPAVGLPEHALALALRESGGEIGPLVGRMWEALDFDAHRGPGPVPAEQIDAQIHRIGDAYLEALWRCSGAPGPVPTGVLPLSRAATAAHMVRDLFLDLELGYCNLPAEDLDRLGLDPADLDPASVAPWVLDRCRHIEAWFDEGEAALSRIRKRRARLLLGAMSWRYRRLTRALREQYASPTWVSPPAGG